MAAASLLMGLPVRDAALGGPEAVAPDLCAWARRGDLAGACLDFHERLLGQVSGEGGPVMGTCHLGLTCFALPVGNRIVTGGYARTESPRGGRPAPLGEEPRRLLEQVGFRAREELRRAVQALQVVLEPVAGEGLEDSGREREETLVFQSAALLTSALNLEPLMRDILDLAVQWSGAEAGTLHLVENQGTTRCVSAARDDGEPPGGRSGSPGLRGWLRARSSGPACEDAPKSCSPPGLGDCGSALFVPLLQHDRPLGQLSLFFRQPRRFSAEETRLLDTFAAHSAMALENARVFQDEQRRARESTALYQAARAIGAGQTRDEVVHAAAWALARTAEVDRALVFLADRHRPVLVLGASVGLTPEQQDFFSAWRLALPQLGERMLRDLQAGRPLLLASPPEDGPGLARLVTLLPSSCCLVLPLLGERALAGLVVLDHSQGAHVFADATVWQPMALAVQVGIALRRAGLIEELEENLSRFRALYQVSIAVASTLSLPRLLGLIVLQALSLVRESASAVLVLNESEEDFGLHASVGLPPALLDLPTQAGLARAALDRRRASVAYLERSPDLAGSPLGQALRDSGFGGVLSVPLVARRRLVGVLNCFAPAGRFFGRQEVSLLRGLANQAAIAVDHARLHGKLQAKMGELETLFEVSRAVTSSLQPDVVFTELVRHVVRILRADACTLRLVEGEVLILKASEGLNPSNLTRRISLGEGVLGMAAQTGRPLTVQDGHEPPGLEMPRAVRSQGLQTALSVPIDHRGQTVGVITAYHRAAVTHAPGDISLLQALASHAGVAIENARIYAEKERVAALLQDALIPRKGLGFPELEVGHRFLPSRDLSGDYYDLIPLGPRRCGLVMADVSGKGAEAAIQTVRAKHLLRSFAMSGHSPAETLRLVNDHLSRDDSGDVRQVTVFYAEADLEARRLQYACAGHEPALLWGGGGDLELLEAEGIVLGAIRKAHFEERSASIPEGASLLLYTDGITEARDPQGQFFGLEGLEDTVRRYGMGEKALSPQSLADRVHARVRKFTERHLADDFSILIVRF